MFYEKKESVTKGERREVLTILGTAHRTTRRQERSFL